MKNILVCCGAAAFTSSLVVKAVEKFLVDNNIQGTVKKCPIREVANHLKAEHYDLLVPTGGYTFDTDVPVISGMPYLTKRGIAEMEEKFKDALAD